MMPGNQVSTEMPPIRNSRILTIGFEDDISTDAEELEMSGAGATVEKTKLAIA